MPLWQSIPLASILLPLAGAALASVLPARAARRWTVLLLCLVTGGSCLLLVRTLPGSTAFTYPMGHFGAPWGNELRAGPLEAMMALLFSGISLLSLLGGVRRLQEDITSHRQSAFCAILLLMQAALMAQVYTNDLFTVYVFVEIMTIAGCALIASRSTRGRGLASAARYMVMNLIASALLLLGIILTYDLTGHLLMEPVQKAILPLQQSGAYALPLTAVIALPVLALAIKAALFPFHTWVPDAYASATPTGAAMLSGVVCKGYLVVLLKVIFRVITPAVVLDAGISDVLFCFGAAGMVMGSVHALRQTEVKRMIAWSSVAQIGYIFLGLGLHTEAGAAAALLHLMGHAAAKSLLFLSVDPLMAVSGRQGRLEHLRGAGLRAPVAGAAFTLGALSLVGIPFLPGFVSKVSLARAALAYGGLHAWGALAVLALSTLLNVLYMLRTVLLIWSPGGSPRDPAVPSPGPLCHLSLGLLSAACLGLGCLAGPVLDAIRAGLAVFGIPL